MTVEAIKEMKRDIINGFEYRDIEVESHDVGDIQYRCENLIYEQGKIRYYCRQYYKNGTADSGGAIICESKEEFLKSPIKEIINQINASYFYNVREVES